MSIGDNLLLVVKNPNFQNTKLLVEAYEVNSRYSASETPSGLVPESPLVPQHHQYFITENPHQTRPK